ncbi:ABC transporter ATP-binding protein [Geminicoccus roseus]|uniref:ABC transporter ATP-binding protein n=1 Tax=Geminicoccus roseus TaxID=404900 RepID=UPI0004178592|nr:ABC transporter ATP-binding protein [Geminicoccus roseus]
MSDIELRGVTKRYGATTVVDGIDLHVQDGEFLTILGPSGSGKTTLLTLIAGLTELSDGRISMAGREVTHVPPAARNIGLVFQSYALFPHMTVYDNVAFPLSIRGLPAAEIERRVGEAFRMVRLTEFATRKPAQLSGGQQQRVALARATVFGPSILLLDEPLGALDRKLREEVQIELRQMQKALGLTSVLVTHDQEEALSLSDRLVVLDKGKVQQVATPTDAYLHPANRFVADFLGVANIFTGTPERLGDAVRLRLADGRLVPCPAPVDGSAGRPVDLLVRPERIRLGAPQEAGLQASVVDAIYLGQSVRYVLDDPAGQRIVAQSADRIARFRHGDVVGVDWEASDGWLIPG